MQNSSYTSTIEWLFQQFPAYHKIGAKAYKPDLTNTLKLCELFNNPHFKLKFIHIAGTNGKGSTSSMLASILQESEQKVGLFTSPHIEDFRERIRINGIMISENEVVDFCNQIKSFNLDIVPSFFEITWVMAIVHFLKNGCTISVIETGLGGRLDATNIISPILSIITNIGLEHTNFLGNTLSLIAGEKAGIIKLNTSIIIGETTPETKIVFENTAKKKNSEIHFSEEIELKLPENFPLIGEYQQKNFKIIQVAQKVLESKNLSFTREQIEKGLTNLYKNTGFRGRMEVVDKQPLTIMDVSHNFDGIQATLETIKKLNQGNLKIIYGTSSDKDLDTIFSLFPKEAIYYFTEFNNERSAKMETLQEKSKVFELNSNFYHSPKKALNEAKLTANENDTLLIFGSFFLISDFY